MSLHDTVSAAQEHLWTMLESSVECMAAVIAKNAASYKLTDAKDALFTAQDSREVCRSHLLSSPLRCSALVPSCDAMVVISFSDGTFSPSASIPDTNTLTFVNSCLFDLVLKLFSICVDCGALSVYASLSRL